MKAYDWEKKLIIVNVPPVFSWALFGTLVLIILSVLLVALGVDIAGSWFVFLILIMSVFGVLHMPYVLVFLVPISIPIVLLFHSALDKVPAYETLWFWIFSIPSFLIGIIMLFRMESAYKELKSTQQVAGGDGTR